MGGLAVFRHRKNNDIENEKFIVFVGFLNNFLGAIFDCDQSCILVWNA